MRVTLDERQLRPRVIARALLLWLVMAVLAVVNGVFRETFLIPRLSSYPAHLLSTGILTAAIIAVAYRYFSTTATDHSQPELLGIGVGWTMLTVGFEFLVGAAEGTPVAVTIGQYNVLAGQVWIILPLTLLLAPLIIDRVLD